MRLTHIKLAGFKSFVDPTSIAVPGQLVAVIGPNGCGKSNVIDAVRWVLGESSAKQLRGESMQDVIFNGSSTRKPVSRASVELVFDNGDGALTGAWGQYAEVAIKRVLTRQGESSYFINNQQVRRRDITDLFLGTGVGARGYAVIEQGMISRIIEARPEELRAYLEEAAGVSKYKERRRETEHRIADTRANLERIADLQQELERQVERLSEQAEVAAQYHDLRGALTHKQNLLALARREEAARNEAAARAELARIETEEAALEAAVTHLEAESETVREGHFAASDEVHEAQQHLFEANAQLARLEEAQRHREQNRARVPRTGQRAHRAPSAGRGPRPGVGGAGRLAAAARRSADAAGRSADDAGGRRRRTAHRRGGIPRHRTTLERLDRAAGQSEPRPRPVAPETGASAPWPGTAVQPRGRAAA